MTENAQKVNSQGVKVTLEAARRYRDAGLAVTAIKPKSKEPRSTKWQDAAPPDDYTLAEWQRKGWLDDGQNIGIVCGETSGNLVIIDFDNPEGYTAFEAKFPHLAETFTVASGSGRGRHYYYRVDLLPKTTEAKPTPIGNLELKSTGRQCVAPPSIHKDTGNPYTVAKYLPIQRVTDLADVANWIQSFLPKANSAPARQKAAASYDNGADSALDYLHESGYVKAVMQRIDPAAQTGHVHCPNPAHTDNDPSFRISFEKDNRGLPLCSCSDSGNSAIPWKTVGEWVNYPYETHKEDTRPARPATSGNGHVKSLPPVTTTPDGLKTITGAQEPLFQADNLARELDPAPNNIIDITAELQWPYAVENGRMVYRKKEVDKDGNVTVSTKPIADFIAQIVETIRSEDGIDTYRIEGETVLKNLFTFEISAESFADTRQLKAALEAASGARCPVAARMSEHLCPAIKKLTTADTLTRRYHRTGWVNGKFLIPGREGEGQTIRIERKLPFALSPDAQLSEGLEGLRALIESQPREASMPLIMALLQPPLAQLAGWHNERYATGIIGRTGSLKTSTVQVAMSMYGADFLRDDLLIKWGEGATRNAIMALATHAHDMPLLIDNFKPNTGGGTRDFVNLIHNILEGGEKDRLNRNSTLREAKPVFCWPIFTCEDIPGDDPASLARVLLIHFKWQRGESNTKLSEAQRLSPHMSAIGAAWLDWLERDEARLSIQKAQGLFDKKRTAFAEILRRYNPEAANILRMATNLATNWLTAYIACDHPAIGPVLMPHMTEYEAGLEAIARDMGTAATESIPAKRFLGALRELLASERTWIHQDKDETPPDRRAPMIGYAGDDHSVYLLFEVAKNAVLDLIGKDGLGNASNEALYSQFRELGLIASSDTARNTRLLRCRGKVIRTLHMTGEAMGNE